MPFYFYHIPAFGDVFLSMPDFLKAVDGRIPNFAVIKVICNYRGNIVGGKRIMKLIGLDLGPNRVPFRNMTAEEEIRMQKELETIGFFKRCNVL